MNATHEIEGFLREVPALKGYPDGEIVHLAGFMKRINLRRGESLFEEDRSAAGLYLVSTGWLKTYRVSSKGKEIVLDIIGPGEFVSSCCATMPNAIHGCSARALSTAKVYQAAGTSWPVVLRECPDIIETLLEKVITARRRCVELASEIVFQDVDSRLASLLLKLSSKSGPVNGGPREIPPLLTHREMAAAIGTAREVVTRRLARLENEGILTREGKTIRIDNPSQLQAMVQEG